MSLASPTKLVKLEHQAVKDEPINERNDRHGSATDDDGNADGTASDSEVTSAHHADIPRPEGLVNKQSPLFSALSRFLSSLEDAMNPDKRSTALKPGEKANKIEQMFKDWREHCGDDLYPLIRLLLPDRDNRRRTYMLKEQKLAKAIILAEGVPETNPDAKRLIAWKVPTQSRKGGDFASTVFDFINSRTLQEKTTMTMDEVNAWLDQLSAAGHNLGQKASRRKPGEEQARLLRDLKNRVTATDYKWIIRIILKDLKLGIGERQVMKAFHPDAMALYNTCSDLLKVCWTLYNPQHRVEGAGSQISVGTPFVPMLCQRNERDLADIVAKMKKLEVTGYRMNLDPSAAVYEFQDDEFLIEEKLDGERIQLHKKGNRFWYFSRKASNYTYLYGGNATEGSLTPYIKNNFDDDFEELILDGEMLVWDPTLRKYIPFGSLKSFAKQEEINDDSTRPCYKVFDVIYAKRYGQEAINLLPAPLKLRRYLLSTIVRPKEGYIELLESSKIKVAKDIYNMLEHVVETKAEGVVVKHPLSPYDLGARNANWVKVKPDYMDELGEKVDAIVIGGYWGQGNRGGKLASYLVGLVEKDSNLYDGEPRVHSFAKVGSGFSLYAYTEIAKRTEGKWFDYRRGTTRHPPAWFLTNSEWPDVLIKPSESFVLRIKASEVVQGVEFKTGKTLRFPRCDWVYSKEERDLSNAMDTTVLSTLLGGESRKRNKGDAMTVKKRSKATKAKKVISVGAPIQARLHGDVGKIFEGLTFYVSNGTYKAEIEGLIDRHGGTRTQTMIPPDVDGVYVSDYYSEKRGIGLKKGWHIDKKDIVSPDWIRDCSTAGRRLPRTAKYYVKVTDATKASKEYNAPVEDVVREDAGESDDDEDELDNVDRVSFARKSASPAKDEDDNGYNTDEEADRRDRKERDMSHAEASESPVEPETEDEDDFGADPTSLTNAKPGMGAGLGRADFDPDKVFDQYVAYFDTSTNATRNGLEIGALADEAKRQKCDHELEKAEKVFVEHGGKVTNNLTESTLTHIVQHDDWTARDVELARKTAQPRHRRVCTIDDWIKPQLGTKGLKFE